MKKVIILGHFAFGKDKANGQKKKKKIVAQELIRVYGEEQVTCEDTMGGWKFLLRLPCILLRILRHHRHVIVLPAYKGVHVILPLLTLCNIVFNRRLHYVVIGGWLPNYVRRSPLLRCSVKALNHVYVETQHMRDDLLAQGINNVHVMPNCKSLDILNPADLSTTVAEPLALCTFSRVMREKGIEDAITAVNAANQHLGHTAFRLDIYGMVEPGQEEWFNTLMQQQPETISYCGIVPFDQSTTILCNYFALLFPTRFLTEGFAGTLIDAMAAGLPPIATDCPSNAELIDNGVNGLLYPMFSVEPLTQILLNIHLSPDIILNMRSTCLRRAADFLPQNVIHVLTDNMQE